MNSIKIAHTLEDSLGGETLDIVIEINEYGITIQPKHDEQKFSDDLQRDIFVEFYLGQLVVHLWDGEHEDPVVTQVIYER